MINEETQNLEEFLWSEDIDELEMLDWLDNRLVEDTLLYHALHDYGDDSDDSEN